MKEEKKKTKKFNKKYLAFGILGLFALALVSAIGYYALFSATFSVTPLIGITGAGDESFSNVQAQATILGNEITLTNNGGESNEVIITTEIINVPTGHEDNVDVGYYELETLEDIRELEKVWGADPDLVDLVGQLEVSVSYENGYVVFKATPPSDYVAETTLTTFTFDTDSDGIVEFQVQYDEAEGWIYSEVNGLVWVKDTTTGWLPVPSGFDTDFTNREFTLKVPMSVLGGLGSVYKFGVQANGDSGHQIFYSTDPAHLWYQTDDYVHSTYYVDMTLGTELTSPLTIPAGSSVGFVPVYDFDQYATGSYTITTEIK